MAPTSQRAPDPERTMGIQDYAMIGNMKTAAMISLEGSIDSFCLPDFDSPSIFCRIVDKHKGGHFSIAPTTPSSVKQAYLPSSNILGTKFLSDAGVGQVTDCMVPRAACKHGDKDGFLPWLIRKIEVVRGEVTFRMECAPAFDYARANHTTEIVEDDSQPEETLGYNKHKVHFSSRDMDIDLRLVVSGESIQGAPSSQNDCQSSSVAAASTARSTLSGLAHQLAERAGLVDSDEKRRKKEQEEEDWARVEDGPKVKLRKLDLSKQGHRGEGVWAEFKVREGEVVTFVLCEVPKAGTSNKPSEHETQTKVPTDQKSKELGVDQETLAKGINKLRNNRDPVLTSALLDRLVEDTNKFWLSWISKSQYKGRWRETVNRQALILKMLTFEETGAVIAAPTFGLPENIGGQRNWDYRYTWIRDSSFVLYGLIRLGYTDEANAFMEFIQQRLVERNADGSIQITYTIHGGKKLGETILDHLAGHKDSKPVRIGNGASDHLQLDVYGEFMDCVYLAQKYSKPLSWDMWVAVREMVDWVCKHSEEKDLSIWEVRGQPKQFTYSQIMMWVAVDRGLRLADKRSLPLPQRNVWLETRDKIYERVMEKAWNKKEKFFAQSFEDIDIVDSAVLIMPLVFFMSASDPRFRSTLDRVLQPPERGGLTINGLVMRYDSTKMDDGVGGQEGAFSMCTLWAIEALSRAGAIDRTLLPKAVGMFEDFLGFSNHVGHFSEEISRGGEALGNTPQGFSALTIISVAYNLNRTLGGSIALN